VFELVFELAMRIERARFLGAGHDQRTAERRGCAGGTKPNRTETPAGSASVQVPKTAGHGGAPFYPQSLERRRRSVRAVMLALAAQQELKRRTLTVRVFPSQDAFLRPVCAALVEIDEKWAADTKAYIKWDCSLSPPDKSDPKGNDCPERPARNIGRRPPRIAGPPCL